jgi:hypothetical protein
MQRFKQRAILTLVVVLALCWAQPALAEEGGMTAAELKQTVWNAQIMFGGAVVAFLIAVVVTFIVLSGANTGRKQHLKQLKEQQRQEALKAPIQYQRQQQPDKWATADEKDNSGEVKFLP